MLLLRIKMRDTITAMDTVFGSITEKTMDLSMVWGLNPNKRLKEIAPSINALPRDSFRLMHMTTRIKTIMIRRRAGMLAKIDIFLFFQEKKLFRHRQLSDNLHEIK
jgi:hypothetical protein